MKTKSPERELREEQHRNTHTPNGYDPRWLDVINQVLSDRETGLQITDIHESLWDDFIGPMIDAIEDDAKSPFTPPYVEFEENDAALYHDKAIKVEAAQ